MNILCKTQIFIIFKDILINVLDLFYLGIIALLCNFNNFIEIMNNILKSLVVVEILLTRNPEFTENSTNLLIKSHLYPASHSFYLKPDSISSEEDENMHYKNCSDILNKFKAYSEMIKSSTSRSLRESMTNEKDQDDKKSSSLYRYFEFKELKIVEITENDENQQIV